MARGLSGARPAPRVFPASRAQAPILDRGPFHGEMPCACSAPCCSSPAPPAPRPLSRPARCLTGRRRHAHGRLFRLRRQQAGDPPWGSSWSTNGGGSTTMPSAAPATSQNSWLQRPAIDTYGEGKHTGAPAGRDGLHAGRDPDADAAKARFLAGLELLKRNADRSQPDRRDRLLLRRQDRPRHGPPGLPLAGVAELPRRSPAPPPRPPARQRVKAKILGGARRVPTAWSRAGDLDALKQGN